MSTNVTIEEQNKDSVVIINDAEPAIIEFPDGCNTVILPDAEPAVITIEKDVVVDLEEDGCCHAVPIVIPDAEPAIIQCEELNVLATIEDCCDDTSIIVTAGETLIIGDLVYILNGKAYLMQVADDSLYQRKVGFAITNASADLPVRIRYSGIVEKSNWNLAINKGYWATANGKITHTVTNEKHILPVGTSMSTDKLMIHFGTSYILR